MHAPSQSDYEGPLQHEANQPPPPPMTGLQIFMSREIGGWPIYTIVIGLGQVCPDMPSKKTETDLIGLDVECHKFPNYSADWSKLAKQSSALCSWRGIFGCFGCMVSPVQIKAIYLCSVSSLDFLWFSLLHDWPAIDQYSTPPSAQRACECGHLVLRCWFCCRISFLWPEFRGGGCTFFLFIKITAHSYSPTLGRSH